MTRRALTPAAAMEIKRLYELRDSKGNLMHSQLQIAGMLGISETTVFRVIHKAGAYVALPAVKTNAEAAASAAAFKEAHPELFGAEGKMVAAVAAEKKKVAVVNETLTDLTQVGGPYDFVQRKDGE